jgi:hypothetical protein
VFHKIYFFWNHVGVGTVHYFYLDGWLYYCILYAQVFSENSSLWNSWFTVIGDDLEPLTITVCSLPIRKSWVHWCKGPEMPKSYFLSKLVWWTLSNAFEKSSNLASIWVLPSNPFDKSLIKPINCVSQDLFFLKPCWCGYSTLFLSRWLTVLLYIICSSILHVILLGRQVCNFVTVVSILIQNILCSRGRQPF